MNYLPKLWRVIKYTLAVMVMAAWGYLMIRLVIAYPHMTPKQQQDFNNMIILMGDD